MIAPLLTLSALTLGCGGVYIDGGKTPGIEDTGLGTGDTSDTGTIIDPSEIDDDEDGYTADVDCDDSDPDVNPGGEEGVVDGDANGKDDDCNGYVDDAAVCEDETGDWETIQEGIDEAPDGATLLVCAGVYAEDLVFADRDLTVIAVEGPDATTVLGGGASPVVAVRGGSSDVAVEGFTITGGLATNGGGVWCQQASLALRDNVITANSADYGGGLFVHTCDVDLSGNTLSENVSAQRGGGAYLENADGTLSGNTLSGNMAYDGGGAFVRSGSLAILDNTFDDNYASNIDEETTWSGRGGGGAGLFVWGDSSIVANVVSNNEGFGGAGVYLYGGSGVFEENLVSGNLCWEDGAGIYANQSSYDLIGNTFWENEALDDAGGMRIYVSRMLVQDNRFYDNVAADDAGGLKLSHSQNTINDNYFEGNSTGDAGGGLELDNETSQASGNVFVRNSAHRGGGMHAWFNEGTMTFADSEFYENHASDCGGGLQVDNMSHRLTLTNLWFEENTSSNDGAAMCVDEVIQTEDDGSTWSEESYVTILNMVAWNNDAADQGGAIYSKTGHLVIRNSTFAGNDGNVGGILLKRSELELVSSIVADNGGLGIALVEDEGLDSTASGSYNDVHGHSDDYYGTDSWDGTDGNIDADPRFTDLEAGDLTLGAGSPCIDAGDPDIDDVDGSRSDMGAYGGPNGDWTP